MDPADLAYAGIARQAQLIRDGEVSSVELVGVYLERIARLNPVLNAFRSVLGERAQLEAEQADARRAGGDERPLLGVPIAVKDDIDVAGEPTTYGTNANERPVQQRRRGGAPAARGGRGDHRQDERPRADDLAVHRDRHVGRDAQPLGSAAQPGWLLGRQRGRGRRGARGSGARLRRRRLDPHPGGVVRAVRAQAPAGARVAGAPLRGPGTVSA